MPSCSNAWKTPGQLSVAQAPIFTACSTEQNAVQLLWVTAAGEANHEPVCGERGTNHFNRPTFPLLLVFSQNTLWKRDVFFPRYHYFKSSS